MGVDLRGNVCADGLARNGGDVDENLVARVMDAARATRSLADNVSALPLELHDEEHESSDAWATSLSRVPEGEIEALKAMADQGQPAAARRVAELLDLDDRPMEAQFWWLRAAREGDADAAMYVKYGYHCQ